MSLTPDVFPLKDGNGNTDRTLIARDENGFIHPYLELLLEKPRRFEYMKRFFSDSGFYQDATELGNDGWEIIFTQAVQCGFECLMKREIRT